MEIDADLGEIITSYHWLLSCLRYLNEKNALLFLFKLWDFLLPLINSSEELWEILSRIPDEKNKIKLLSILRLRWFTRLLYDARDLWNIFEWLYEDSQKEFIDLLWKDFVKKIFSSTHEIIMTLYYLSDENKDYLMSIIWMEKSKQKIKTSENLLIMYKWLTSKNAKKLLKKFTKDEILNLFRNENEFYQFLLRLPIEKEKIFLDYLKK